MKRTLEELGVVMFEMEIEHQAVLALRAFDALRLALAANDQPDVWLAVQGILASAANVSKILWPTKNMSRGEILRTRLGVSDTSPLRLRTVRNHFEHFDERLDAWVAAVLEKGHGAFADSHIGEKADLHFADREEERFRNLDRTALVVTFWKGSVELTTLENALREIQVKAKRNFPPGRRFKLRPAGR